MASEKSNDERIEKIQSQVDDNFDDIQKLRDRNKKLLKRIQLIEEFIRKQSEINGKIAGNQARIIKLKT
tara:strand:- start:5836 stop:6042 length:207 start_codon:yes stop_codon:yes gene_type:complete